MTIHLQQARYLYSVYAIDEIPQERGGEIALIGPSNVGKSSLINALCMQKGLAHTSKTPGRTQALNFYEIGVAAYLVDLPGYGYAQVTAAQREQWYTLINHYLTTRAALRGVILVIDIRRELTSSDMQIINWCVDRNLSLALVLNKSDKLSAQQIRRQQQITLSEVTKLHNIKKVFVCSATTKSGIENLRTWLVKTVQ